MRLELIKQTNQADLIFLLSLECSLLVEDFKETGVRSKKLKLKLKYRLKWCEAELEVG